MSSRIEDRRELLLRQDLFEGFDGRELDELIEASRIGAPSFG